MIKKREKERGRWKRKPKVELSGEGQVDICLIEFIKDDYYCNGYMSSIPFVCNTWQILRSPAGM